MMTLTTRRAWRPADKIRIVAFQPSGTVKRGVETQFTIQIEVDLQSAKEGVARVGFNLDSPTSFRMIDSRDLHEGIQKISFAVKAKPVDWGNRGYFAVIVNMGPKTTERPMDTHSFGPQSHSCEAMNGSSAVAKVGCATVDTNSSHQHGILINFISSDIVSH